MAFSESGLGKHLTDTTGGAKLLNFTCEDGEGRAIFR